MIYTDYEPKPKTATSPGLHAIDELPDDAAHRPVDLAIIASDAAGDVKSYIVLPSTVWGEATGELFDIGFSNSYSQQLPELIRVALDRQQAGMVGKGVNIWPHIHIDDTGDLFDLVYSGALRDDIGHGYSGFYFGTAGEYTLLGAAHAIGSALVAQGHGKAAEPTTFSDDEIKKYHRGAYYSGTNSRAVSERSMRIGWKPRYTEMVDMEKHLGDEMIRLVKKYGTTYSG